MTILKTIEKNISNAHTTKHFMIYLAALAWLPMSKVFAADSATTPFVSAISMYRAEVIIIASFLLLVLGAFLSTRYEPPTDVPSGSRMDLATKFLFAIAGGVVAFIYVLEEKQTLTVLHPVWVLGVSIVTPSFVQIAFPVIVKIWYKFVKAKEGNISND